MSTLIMMVGISGSGKSTKAQELSKLYKATIYSSDQLREELYGNVNDQTHNNEIFVELHKRIIQDLKNGISVIYYTMPRYPFQTFLSRFSGFYPIKLLFINMNNYYSYL